MAGRWSANATTEPVPLSWKSTTEGHGQIFATLGRGGEHFHGKYIRVQGDHSEVVVRAVYDNWNAPGWAELDWGPEGNYPVGESIDFSTFLHNYSGRVVATLFGDSGSSMRCQFTLEDGQRGMLSGGVGTCQVSDGSRIDVQF